MTRKTGCGCMGCFFRLMSLLAALLLLSALWGVVEARGLNVDYRTVKVRGLPAGFDGVTVVFASDLHQGPFAGKDEMDKLVNKINELEPDMLLLGGDYVENGSSDKTELLDGLSRIEAPLGKFAVLGNHDTGDSAEAWRKLLANEGVTLLQNESAVVTHKGGKLHIVGVGDYTTRQADSKAAMQNVPNGVVCLFLSHNPDILYTIMGATYENRIGLTVSGHTHGGQVSLFGIYTPITNSLYGTEFLSGWSEMSGYMHLTSNGVGTTIAPIRFMAPPQIHFITLKVEE